MRFKTRFPLHMANHVVAQGILKQIIEKGNFQEFILEENILSKVLLGVRSLLLGSNVEGNIKLQPILVSRSQNLQTLVYVIHRQLLGG